MARNKLRLLNQLLEIRAKKKWRAGKNLVQIST
jgi:hypothetical protein